MLPILGDLIRLNASKDQPQIYDLNCENAFSVTFAIAQNPIFVIFAMMLLETTSFEIGHNLSTNYCRFKYYTNILYLELIIVPCTIVNAAFCIRYSSGGKCSELSRSAFPLRMPNTDKKNTSQAISKQTDFCRTISKQSAPKNGPIFDAKWHELGLRWLFFQLVSLIVLFACVFCLQAASESEWKHAIRIFDPLPDRLHFDVLFSLCFPSITWTSLLLKFCSDIIDVVMW